jgi:hypothetical protein
LTNCADSPTVQGSILPLAAEEIVVAWETPNFVEIKMDAEINSYQDDFGGDYH